MSGTWGDWAKSFKARKDAAEAKKVEEAKKAEEEKKAPEVKKAEEEKKASDMKVAEDLRQESRKMEEMRRTWQEDQAYEARKAEEDKKASEAKLAEESRRESRKLEEIRRIAEREEMKKASYMADAAEDAKRAAESAKRARVERDMRDLPSTNGEELQPRPGTEFSNLEFSESIQKRYTNDLRPLTTAHTGVDNTRAAGVLATPIKVVVDGTRIKPWWIKNFCAGFGELGALTKQGDGVAIVEFVKQVDADQCMKVLKRGSVLENGNDISGSWKGGGRGGGGGRDSRRDDSRSRRGRDNSRDRGHGDSSHRSQRSRSGGRSRR